MFRQILVTVISAVILHLLFYVAEAVRKQIVEDLLKEIKKSSNK